MIDIVIPLGNGSLWENNELRYALRSIEKHVKEIRDVYLIGEKPSFLNDEIKHIPIEDKSDIPSKNILNKILKATITKDISSTFLFTNDDIFFTRDINAVDYPFYYHEDLRWNIERTHYQNWYKDYLNETLVALDMEYETKNFDTHFPIRYNKVLFNNVYQQWKEEWDDNKKLLIKSLYCNTLGVNGFNKEDLKFKGFISYEALKQLTKDRDCFSIGDTVITDDFKKFINELFLDKSKYEI